MLKTYLEANLLIKTAQFFFYLRLLMHERLSHQILTFFLSLLLLTTFCSIFVNAEMFNFNIFEGFLLQDFVCLMLHSHKQQLAVTEQPIHFQ